MDPYVLRIVNGEIRARRAVLRVLDLGDGRDRAVRESDTVAGELGQAIRGAFDRGSSAIVEADGRRWFLNLHLPPPRLVIIGAAHISQALAPMAKLAGLDVTLVDPRTAFATQARFPGVHVLADWPEAAFAVQPLDRHTALAAITHDPKIDDPALVAALSANCFYIGALGSRRTHARRLERLHAAGIPPALTRRIEAPIGLDIGAASPAEIAVAILASIIRVLRLRAPVPSQLEEVPT